eukprot:365596-Chlamydomonas_euryale.AAC.20
MSAKHGGPLGGWVVCACNHDPQTVLPFAIGKAYSIRVAQYGRISRSCRTYGTRYGTVRSYGGTDGGRGTGCGRVPALALAPPPPSPAPSLTDAPHVLRETILCPLHEVSPPVK